MSGDPCWWQLIFLRCQKDENFLKFLLNPWNLRDLLGSSCLVYYITKLILVFLFKMAWIIFVLCWVHSPRNRPQKVVKKKKSPNSGPVECDFKKIQARIKVVNTASLFLGKEGMGLAKCPASLSRNKQKRWEEKLLPPSKGQGPPRRVRGLLLTPCHMLWFHFWFPGIMANSETSPKSCPSGTVYATLSVGSEQTDR